MNTKQSIDQLEVLKNGVISYRTVTLTIRSDAQTSSTYHRSILVPGQSLDGIPQEVQDVAQTAWTTEVLALWVEKMSNPPA